jgi:hypothetical protein
MSLWHTGEQESEWQEEFTAAARAFLANGGELDYYVGVRIALAAPCPPAPTECHQLSIRCRHGGSA